ncbi:MAG: hypothetical protein WCW44_06475 [archaeon]|jgi:hypothetical protein
MAWGWEFIAGLDPFAHGMTGVIGSFVFLFVFGYIAARGGENPIEKTVETIGLAFVAGLFLVMFNLPPLFIGMGYLVAYVLAIKYLNKIKTDFNWFLSLCYLAAVFGLLAVMDAFSGLWWTIGATVLLVAMNELSIKEDAKKKTKK